VLARHDGILFIKPFFAFARAYRKIGWMKSPEIE
jgi:hypothetical protein